MPVRTLTLTAGVARTVDLASDAQTVAVYNLGVTSDIITVGLGNVAPAPDADDTYAVPPGSRRQMNWGRITGRQVRLYSPGPSKAEVEWS